MLAITRVAALVNGIVSGHLCGSASTVWSTCVKRKCKDNYSIFIRSIDKRKGKVL